MSLMLTRTILYAVAFAIVSACAHPSSEEVVGPRRPPTAAAPLPFPETAFQPDAPTTATKTTATATEPRQSRFDTRTIGALPASLAPRYRGAPVNLDLKNADLSNVFRLLADVGHVNIVVSGEVTGTITLRLEQVPWDQALELVARTRDLDLSREGNVIVVRAPRKP